MEQCAECPVSHVNSVRPIYTGSFSLYLAWLGTSVFVQTFGDVATWNSFLAGDFGGTKGVSSLLVILQSGSMTIMQQILVESTGRWTWTFIQAIAYCFWTGLEGRNCLAVSAVWVFVFPSVLVACEGSRADILGSVDLSRSLSVLCIQWKMIRISSLCIQWKMVRISSLSKERLAIRAALECNCFSFLWADGR